MIHEPIRLPIQQTTHMPMTVLHFICRRSAAAPSTRLFPVNSSLPAITTRLSAAAKVSETKNLVIVQPESVQIPPMDIAINPPKEINIPATMDAMIYPTGLPRSRADLAAAALQSASYSFRNMIFPRFLYYFFQRSKLFSSSFFFGRLISIRTHSLTSLPLYSSSYIAVVIGISMPAFCASI